MTRGPKCRNRSRDFDHAHLGAVSRQKASTSRGQLIYKICICTRYEDMKGGAKRRKLGSLGQSGVIQGHRQCHHLISYSTLIETMYIPCIPFSRYSELLFVERC